MRRREPPEAGDTSDPPWLRATSAGDDPPPGWSLARHPYQLPTRGERVLLEARRNGGEGGTGLA